MPRRERQVKRDDGYEDRDYEVEMILESQVRQGRTWYRIKWKGFDDSWNTWEPEDLMNCPDKVKEFQKRKVEKIDKTLIPKNLPAKSITKTTTKSVPLPPPLPIVEDDVEVVQFAVVDKTNEVAVLFKINDQYELVPYRSARGQEKFQLPIIDYFEKHIVFHENESRAEVLIDV